MNCRVLLLVLLCFSLTACQQENDYVRLNGFTMGTSYQVTLQTTEDQAKQIHQSIENRLRNINQLMSTYIEDSEISRFNRSKSLECQLVSNDTYFVVRTALEISKETKGKFDVTLAPLISEWGFDRKRTNDVVPTDKRIEKLLKQIGYKNIHIQDQCIQKLNQNISINLSAIAKGYGVDEIAALLTNSGIGNYLVEIGGETASRGVNPKSLLWRLAIEAPIKQQRQIQQVFSPLELGVATSGDYRNYFEKDGIRFSHTLDPINGKPITHRLVSATVLHKRTMLADAYATAFMVMGAEKSLAFAKKNNLPIYLLVKKGDGFEAIYSEAFKKHLL